MNDPVNIIAKKTVNALIPAAEPRFPMGKPVGIVLEWAKAFYRGLWVGGTMYLLPDCLDFRPNALNRFVHKNDVSHRVPLADIVSVIDHFGVATRIVVVQLRNGTEFQFRCYGAAEFAQIIRDQMQVSGASKNVLSQSA